VHDSTRTIWRLSWPVMVGITSHMLFHLVDLYWIGHLGAQSLAGVAAAGSVLMFLWTGTRVAHGGGVACISQAFGRRYDRVLRRGAADTLVAGTVLGLVVGVAAYAVIDPVVAFFDLDAPSSTAARTYLQIILLGIPCMYAGEGASAYVVGVGRTRVMMVVGLICNVLNLVLDPLFIFGAGPIPAMGLAGAAWASLASGILLTTMLLVWLVRTVGLTAADLRFDRRRVTTILSIGAPAAARDVSRPLVAMVMIKLVAGYGGAVVAAYGIASRLIGMVIIYIIGLSVALTQLCGKRIGEGRPEAVPRILAIGAAMGLAIHAVVGGLLFVGARSVLALFDGQGDVVAAGVPIVRIFVVMMVFSLAARVMGAAFSGSGTTGPSMVSSVTTHWGVQFPGAGAAVHCGFGPIGVWCSILAARVVEAMLLYAYYRAGSWRLSAVPLDDDSEVVPAPAS